MNAGCNTNTFATKTYPTTLQHNVTPTTSTTNTACTQHTAGDSSDTMPCHCALASREKVHFWL